MLSKFSSHDIDRTDRMPTTREISHVPHIYIYMRERDERQRKNI